MFIEKEVLIQQADGTVKPWIQGTCLSTEDKPTNVVFGSRLMEIDTATMYHFNQNSSTWVAWRRS